MRPGVQASQWEWISEQKDTKHGRCPQGQSAAVVLLSTWKMDTCPLRSQVDGLTARVKTLCQNPVLTKHLPPALCSLSTQLNPQISSKMCVLDGSSSCQIAPSDLRVNQNRQTVREGSEMTKGEMAASNIFIDSNLQV